jgi:hypothetical protein
MGARNKSLIACVWLVVLVMVVVLTACDEGAPPGVSQSGGSSSSPTPAAGNAATAGAPTATLVSAVQKDIDPNTIATRMPLKVDATAIIKQGEGAAICGVTIRVNSLTRQPAKGTGGRKDLMVASVELENKGEKQVAIITYDFYLSDSAGKVMQLSYGGDVKTPLAGGPLDPMKSMGGEVAYDVAADQKDFKVLWMPGWCADKAVVAVPETQQK